MDDASKRAALSRVPEITLSFWIIKIAATTLGETGGDSVTMTLNWGYLAGTLLFMSLLVVLVRSSLCRHDRQGCKPGSPDGIQCSQP